MFHTPLKVQLLNDRGQFPWITLAPLVYESALTGETYTVPANFRTDGASVPSALMLFAAPVAMRYFGEGVWLGFREGVLHDYLRRKRADGTTPVPAAVAHKVFREALTEAGYPEDLVANYYAAVATFNP